jgi:restriction endonuclease Mrr
VGHDISLYREKAYVRFSAGNEDKYGFYEVIDMAKHNNGVSGDGGYDYISREDVLKLRDYLMSKDLERYSRPIEELSQLAYGMDDKELCLIYFG